MLDIRQSKNYADYLSSLGWIVERIDNTNYFIKKFPLIGSIIKIQRPEKIDNKKINSLVKKYRAFQIILEPKSKNQRLKNFKLSHSPYLPTKTLHLDLTKTEKQLFKNLKKDCQGYIKRGKAELNETSPNKFRAAWKKAVGLKRYVPSEKQLNLLKKAFKKNSLFLTTKDYSSGAISLLSDKTAYYWQAFTDKKGRKKHYQYEIVWQGILWAKKKGAKIFDFEGIYDERFPNKSWLGFTHFKKSFGGKEIEHPGSFIKFQLPF
jgi:hypothetical protein